MIYSNELKIITKNARIKRENDTVARNENRRDNIDKNLTDILLQYARQGACYIYVPKSGILYSDIIETGYDKQLIENGFKLRDYKNEYFEHPLSGDIEYLMIDWSEDNDR
jgi:hypothetical protein